MAINEYEMILVTRPELPEDVVLGIKERVSGYITENKGSLLVFESWGQRKLAYPIQKSQYGNYYLINYVGEGNIPQGLESLIKLRLDSSVVRYITVKLDSDIKDLGDPELVEARSAAAQTRSQKTIDKLNAVSSYNNNN